MGPDFFAGGRVETVKHAAATERIDLAVVKGRRCSRASARDSFFEAGLVFVRPELIAGGEADANNGFGPAAWHFIESTVTNDGQPPLAGADSTEPKLARRLGVQIGIEADMVHVRVAVRAAEASPVRGRGNEVGGWFYRCI